MSPSLGVDDFAHGYADARVLFVARNQEITAAPGGHNQIARQIGVQIEQVPIVEIGEYGRDRDPPRSQRCSVS